MTAPRGIFGSDDLHPRWWSALLVGSVVRLIHTLFKIVYRRQRRDQKKKLKKNSFEAWLLLFRCEG